MLTADQIGRLSAASFEYLDDLLHWANRIRWEYFGNKIRVCSIVPGRLGGMQSDCAFCAQSVRYETAVDKTPKVLTDDEIIAAAAEVKAKGVPNFGIVYSGKAVSSAELERLIGLTERIREEFGLGVCMGLGILAARRCGVWRRRVWCGTITTLRRRGGISEKSLRRIRTTSEWRRLRRRLRRVWGCVAGGIFGIGETEQDRLDMALELRRLGVDTVPMNFLHPIAGPPLGTLETLRPREILRIIALYRFILPKVNLKVAGGRVLNLRDVQSWIFYAGCTSILSGNYLTTAGRAVEEDMQMLYDLGLEPIGEELKNN